MCPVRRGGGVLFRSRRVRRVVSHERVYFTSCNYADCKSGADGPPPRWTYPDIVTLNETEYRSENTSELEYRSGGDELLDLGSH